MFPVTSFLFQVTLLCSYFLCYPHHSTLFPLPFRNDSNAVTANIPVEPLSVLKPTNNVSSSIPLSSLFQMTGNRIWLSDHLITVSSNIYINIVRHTKQNTYSIHLYNWYLPGHNLQTCTLFVFPVSCFLFPGSCFLFPGSWFLVPASCFLFPVFYFLFVVCCLLFVMHLDHLPRHCCISWSSSLISYRFPHIV